jgi:hypothetical protein
MTTRALLRATGWLVLLGVTAALVTGLLLGWSYAPTSSQAHRSVVDLESTSVFGAGLRSMHLLSSHAAVVLSLLHLLLVVARRAFAGWLGGGGEEGPGWTSGGLALGLLLLLAFGGRILAWDTHGGVSLVMLESFLRVGDASPLGALLGDVPLRRLWMIHLLASGLLVLCMALHAPLRRVLADWRDGGRSLRPVALGAAALAALLIASVTLRAPLGPDFALTAADPLAQLGVSAQWYLRWLQVLCVASIGLAQLVLAALFGLGLATPALARSIGAGRVRALWLAVLAGLIVVSLLPSGGA